MGGGLGEAKPPGNFTRGVAMDPAPPEKTGFSPPFS